MYSMFPGKRTHSPFCRGVQLPEALWQTCIRGRGIPGTREKTLYIYISKVVCTRNINRTLNGERGIAAASEQGEIMFHLSRS